MIEFARNVCHLEGADSTEFNERTPHKVIHLLKDLVGVKDMGGTMRLGQYPCRIANPSFAYEAYQQEEVYERHRHRYEFNREYEEMLVKNGMRIVGESPDKRYAEIVELTEHPWFVACQFHPEWKAKPLQPHSLYSNFIKAAYDHRQRRKHSNH